MTERIDHAAEARESLRGSGDGRNFATDASANAIAHAVLALVEQQRIANLLQVHEALSHAADYDLAAELWNDEIKEALGL